MEYTKIELKLEKIDLRPDQVYGFKTVNINYNAEAWSEGKAPPPTPTSTEIIKWEPMIIMGREKRRYMVQTKQKEIIDNMLQIRKEEIEGRLVHSYSQGRQLGLSLAYKQFNNLPWYKKIFKQF